MEMSEAYLKAILATVARQTFPPEMLAKLVMPKGGGEKQLTAYNLCDGQHTQAEIGKAVSLDKGNLSRTIARWVEQGIVFRVGDGNDVRPLHLYPLVQETEPKKEKKNGGK